MAQGYNRYNFLLKVQAVCEIYKQYKKEGVTTGFIYNQYIKDVYFVSRTTFFAYLNINYKKELADIEKQRKSQLN